MDSANYTYSLDSQSNGVASYQSGGWSSDDTYHFLSAERGLLFYNELENNESITSAALFKVLSSITALLRKA